ncbi:MOSC domain-containing protein [Mesorhizobium sp. B2-3-13]|uniref:MOSC and FAD-binding oxidoreductase domain-containing protein n=1 Tax=Mesorhizobium sp. B2-3-13 TaxID=2589951 RepID=UPI00112DAA47|nr:MOSC and FAD-binding oxidoreductase domain-containing protein [Mesorhizobium sp. B2-3-13]TPL89729.1 MOSC domain-containing protein [Mesorhizobium sp. B2-3-13]
MARLLSVNVGLPRGIPWQGKIVDTAVWKAPVEGPCQVRRLNIDGDGQGDIAGHGGEQRAVLVYQIDSYRFWQSELGRNDFVYGQFGENFTVDGLPDREVCIGDRYRIGSALLEVTQPRVTCYRVGIRMNEPRMAALLVAHGRPGFYLRVLEEGQVQAGDEITRVEIGPEAMTVSEVDALLYTPSHPRSQLERALRIPALSPGWQGSFRALLAQGEKGTTTGNAGLDPVSGRPPAWPGFRPLKVARKVHESGTVVSLILEPTDDSHLYAAIPGQFVVLRLAVSADGPAVMRSYSLSSAPGDRCYRVSVKREPHGEASTFIDESVQVGDFLDVSAPRGNFILGDEDRPIVLLSAGVGVTPMMSMLHALAARASTQEVWWFHGAHCGREHPFAEEARNLLEALTRSHSHIRYSSPDREDRLGVDFDAIGRLDVRALQDLGVPPDADFYICGPSVFMSGMTAGLATRAVAPARIHTEVFGPGPSTTPGIASDPSRSPHPLVEAPNAGPRVSFARSGLSVRWGSRFQSLLELAEACDVPTRWSCRTGVCHTCETGLVTGTVTYSPEPIDPPATANALICCSQPDGDVVLDL